MKIVMKSKGPGMSETWRNRVMLRLQAALAHWADRVERVVVRLADMGGVRAELDKVCSIELEVPRHAPIVVRAVSSDYASAVDLAVRRAGRAATRTLGRPL